MSRKWFSFQALQTWLTILVLSMVLTVSAAPHSLPEGEWQQTFDKGVQFYRDGEFSKAYPVFYKIVQGVPESAEARYYYAITLAQLGRFREAREAYQAVIKLAPGSESAQLSQEGLDGLPAPEQLDTPPQLSRKPQPMPRASQVVQNNTFGQATQSAAQAGGMDPQMLQMMMLMGASGGKGGFNPMMIPLLQGMTGGQNGAPTDPKNNIPPDVFKTLMMQDMMKDFGNFGSKNDDD